MNGGAHAVAVLPDDRIVVVGSTWRLYEANDGVVAVLDTDGDLDPSFGEGGTVVDPLDYSTYFAAVAVDAQGRIVVGGYTAADGGPRQTAIIRYRQDGSRDPTFGTDPGLPGVTRIREPCSVTISDLEVQTDGSIVATGPACPYPWKHSVLRLLADGTPDATLGENGLLLLHQGYPHDVLVSRAEGEDLGLLVGGTVESDAGLYDTDFSVTRLALGGTLDASFGNGGTATTDFGVESSGLADQLNSLARTSSGQILAAGHKQLTVPIPNQPWHKAYDFLVAAYDSEGNVDESFGEAGSVLIDFGTDSDFGTEVLVRSNGNIVVVGNAQPLSWDKELCIAHLLPDGSPSADLYRSIKGIEGLGLGARGAVLDRHDRVVVAGDMNYEGGGRRYFVARYLFREN